MLAKTPPPPYYAVLFSSIRTEVEDAEYEQMAKRMVELAEKQAGFLGVESARSGLGITVSYWASKAAIRAWKMHSEHIIAQEFGKAKWYSCYKTRICLVERDYGQDSL